MSLLVLDKSCKGGLALHPTPLWSTWLKLLQASHCVFKECSSEFLRCKPRYKLIVGVPGCSLMPSPAAIFMFSRNTAHCDPISDMACMLKMWHESLSLKKNAEVEGSILW